MSRSRRERRPTADGLRILVTVTFKPNQLRAHLLPIVALDEVASVTLVADHPGPPIPKVEALVPPAWLVRTVGRAAAKLSIAVLAARRERPDWVIGFNLVPHGINAWIAGRLSGAQTLYHQIGGPVEWEGGGWRSDNNILGRLPRSAPPLEKLLLGVARRCTLVATMGEKGRRALIEQGLEPDRVHAIPAVVDTERFRPRDAVSPTYDLLIVGELIETKQMHVLLEAVSALQGRGHEVRAAVVGTGPLEEQLQARARELGIAGKVDFLGFRNDVESLYASSKIFVLTSRYEGLSVALTEAMASGLPVVISDVGEQRELVREGRNGYLFEVGDTATLTDRLELLLGDAELRSRLGQAAAEDAVALAGVDRVATLYRRLLTAGATS
jgi:glycosyltransferase involved in cell wall biosynthesis